MKPWPIITEDDEVQIVLPEFYDTYFGDVDTMTPEEWAIVRQISATPMMLAACKGVLASIILAQGVFRDSVARGVFEGAFLGVEAELRAAIAQTEEAQ